MSTTFRHQQATWLYQQWMIDVPKIFDLCVIYGVDNPRLVQAFLQDLFSLQPKYLDDIEEMVPTLIENLYLLEERCNDALVRFQEKDETGLLGWSDVLRYLLDVCLNVSIFVENCALAVHRLLHNRGALVYTLAKIHDTLLPQFEGSLRQFGEEQKHIQTLIQQSLLAKSVIVKTVYVILEAAFLKEINADASSATSQVNF